MKIADSCSAQGDRLLFVCDFSPPRSADPGALARAQGLDTDYICVAYNPGRAVRVDSAMLASSIKRAANVEVIFNLATRDMNKLAVQSHLLGAQLLGLENVMVVQGDPFTERDLAQLKDVSDYSPTALIRAMNAMNEGADFRGAKLGAPTDFCVGGSIDLNRGIESEAALTYRKVLSGAHFFLAQPVFSTQEIQDFYVAYRSVAGSELLQPVFFGVQVLAKDGVIFSNVPQNIRADLDKGRSGTDVALEILGRFLEIGLKRIYLVPPILRGGARDYEAAQVVLATARSWQRDRGKGEL